MNRKALRVLGLVAAVGLMVWGGFTVAAAHGGSGKCMGHHETGHAHHAIASLIQDLDLSEEQQAQLTTIHDNLAEMPFGQSGHAAHLVVMVEHIQRGQLNSGAVRQMVDEHVEQLRQSAYRLGDGLVALLDSLDVDQQETLSKHLDAAAAHMSESGHGQEHSSHGHGHHGQGHGRHDDSNDGSSQE
jgi:Spy/CpxP family protein refolding chaperone